MEPQAALPGPGGPASALPPAGRPAPASDQDPRGRQAPRPSAGLQLLGEYQGSGFTEPRYLARRGDGQVVQLTRLLHLVVAAVDGQRSTAEIARLVRLRSGREVSAANVAYLIDRKLTPLGLTLPPGRDDSPADAPRSDLLLVLKGHTVLLRPARVNRVGRALAWLHRTPVVALALAAAVAMDVWLFAVHGALAPVLAVLDRPALLLAVFGLTVASLVFHEFGHASACRHGGAIPGCIGCGLYLVWPSLYTDVTDVYRIGRAGRIRTDLGGVYFNVLFMLGLCGCYLLTGQQFLLAAVYLGHFEILEQLLPALRLDGYYILGDLAGVPDLYGKVRPILLSAIPGRPVHPEAAALKRSARVTVTAWVLTMVPLVLGELGYALWNLPRLTGTAVHSLHVQLGATASALDDGRMAAAAVAALGSAMLLLPAAGAGYLALRVGGRLLRALRRWAARGRGARLALALGAVALLTALGAAWADDVLPQRQLPPRQASLVPTEPAKAPTGSAVGHGRAVTTPHGAAGRVPLPVRTHRTTSAPVPPTPPPSASASAPAPASPSPGPGRSPSPPPSRSASAAPSPSPSSSPSASATATPGSTAPSQSTSPAAPSPSAAPPVPPSPTPGGTPP
ncbi:hypothetical protein [Streptacidiphilus monticola]|uniref:Peptide zinc metalloprotease protein n=1 Tax=Streptacidiphilus monticola TaxID=2161674 RepID=A0ABW1FZF3_9ACTN